MSSTLSTASRIAIATSLAVAICMIGPVPARTQTRAGVTMTPVQVEPAAPIEDRTFSQALTIQNQDSRAYVVGLSVVELAHDLDGTPRYPPSDVHARAFRLDRQEIRLGPRSRQTVSLAGSIPESSRSIYVGVLAEFAPEDVERVPTVETRTQLAAQFLLRGPRPWRRALEVVDVGFLEPESRDLRVYAVAENVGNVHVAPRVTAFVLRDGSQIARVRLQGGRVLPGYSRRFAGTWRPPRGLDGVVTVRVVFDDPHAERTERVTFREGTATAPAAEIENFVANVDQQTPLVSLDVRNTGTARLSPVIELVATEGKAERARAVLPLEAPLTVGATQTVTWRPALADGRYRLTAIAREGQLLLDQEVTGVVVGGQARDPVRKARSPLGLVAAALAALAALAVGLTARARLRATRIGER